MADVAVRGAELFSVKLPKASHHNFSLSEDGFDLPGPCDQIVEFASAGHAQCSTHLYEVRPRKDKRGVDLISDACHSVGCGMTRAIMQSATQNFTADRTPL
jgi:hypothetical protein